RLQIAIPLELLYKKRSNRIKIACSAKLSKAHRVGKFTTNNEINIGKMIHYELSDEIQKGPILLVEKAKAQSIQIKNDGDFVRKDPSTTVSDFSTYDLILPVFTYSSPFDWETVKGCLISDNARSGGRIGDFIIRAANDASQTSIYIMAYDISLDHKKDFCTVQINGEQSQTQKEGRILPDSSGYIYEFKFDKRYEEGSLKIKLSTGKQQFERQISFKSVKYSLLETDIVKTKLGFIYPINWTNGLIHLNNKTRSIPQESNNLNFHLLEGQSTLSGKIEDWNFESALHISKDLVNIYSIAGKFTDTDIYFACLVRHALSPKTKLEYVIHGKEIINLKLNKDGLVAQQFALEDTAFKYTNHKSYALFEIKLNRKKLMEDAKSIRMSININVPGFQKRNILTNSNFSIFNKKDLPDTMFLDNKKMPPAMPLKSGLEKNLIIDAEKIKIVD
ncbi:MAG: hypothetical protein HRT89_05585, partial [Lentisphaeria bacterium]|nr:hypothetical protein [Lentisphaeria bacterium]NQZ67523.1 hypothetical protein [Lentisphaeria bacterium]